MFNLSKTLVLILSASALSTAAVNAFAVDGTITIIGKVVDETCILTGGSNTDGKGKDITVTLDTVKKNVFTAQNKTAGTKSFDLELTQGSGGGACDAVTNSGFKGIYISTASNSNYLPTNTTALINTAATGTDNPVYIQLLTDADIPVDYNAAWGVQAKSSIKNQSTKPTLTYKARYLTETGVVKPQNVSAVVNYTLQYN